MSDYSADIQYPDAGKAAGNNCFVAMVPVAHCEGEQTDRHDDDQHLCVKVRCIELREQRQGHDDDRQQQAMNEAQSRQRDRRIIEDAAVP